MSGGTRNPGSITGWGSDPNEPESPASRDPESQEGEKPSGRRVGHVEGRKRARRLIVQALYRLQLSPSSLAQVEAEFRAEQDFSKVDTAYFSEVLRGIELEKDQIDQRLSSVVSRALTSVDPVELAVIRLGAYELMNRLDVPWRVVINESIELVKRFGGTEGHRFVNSVLERIALQSRGDEVASDRRGGKSRR